MAKHPGSQGLSSGSALAAWPLPAAGGRDGPPLPQPAGRRLAGGTRRAGREKVRRSLSGFQGWSYRGGRISDMCRTGCKRDEVMVQVGTSACCRLCWTCVVSMRCFINQPAGKTNNKKNADRYGCAYFRDPFLGDSQRGACPWGLLFFQARLSDVLCGLASFQGTLCNAAASQGQLSTSCPRRR